MSRAAPNKRTGAVRLFIYGSLLPGQYNHFVAEPFVLQAFPGQVRGKLADAGCYPALVIGSGGIVRGLWMDIAREGLPAIDELEEFFGIEEKNDYERVWVTDAENPAVEGWVYAWTDARGFPLTEEEWWPDVIRDKQDNNEKRQR
ncbi:gamma-glutamylcyclotransferase family protein [Cohnella boryungensis]|uniref:Gamma-glutamylcyclotransferase n=1 Tax=Cohnella boryungensis TaxID=768479 RepID=A0ABV8SC52_9BACL